MWLLDVDTRRLVPFMDDRKVIDKYAILSHTWGEDEVSFADIHKPEAKVMQGYRKIDLTCRQAKIYGLQYAWVDTCCINKDSSAELSEAINSMFRWYQNSNICYVWLEDVSTTGHNGSFAQGDKSQRRKILDKQLAACRWKTRGWTLQELLAPCSLVVYDCGWFAIGTVKGKNADVYLQRALAVATGIHLDIITGAAGLATVPISLILSWASLRHTTRVEDEAYSLLGLLGINMPLLYGEGSRAFVRLQQEVYKQTNDVSILFWTPYNQEQIEWLFAPDIFCFRCTTGENHDRLPSTRFGHSEVSDNIITNRGLKTSFVVHETADNVGLLLSDPTGTLLVRPIADRLPILVSASSLRQFSVVRVDDCYRRTQGKGKMMEMTLCRHVQQHAFIFDLDDGLTLANIYDQPCAEGQRDYYTRPVRQLLVGVRHPISRKTAIFTVDTDLSHAFWNHRGKEVGQPFAEFRGLGFLIAKCYDHTYRLFDHGETSAAGDSGWNRDHYTNCPIPPGTFVICIRKVAADCGLDAMRSREEVNQKIAKHFSGPRDQALKQIARIAHPAERPQA